MDNDDYIDIEPWSASEIAGHLIAQVTLGRRGLIESDQESDVFERETDRFELEAWSRLELTPWLREHQFAILDSPLGLLSAEQVEMANDGLVIGSTLGWAMYLVKSDSLPLQSDGAPEMQMLEWAPTPWTPVRNMVKSLKVRTEEDLATERERWELVHWRSLLFTDPDTADEDQASLVETVAELRELGTIAIASNDFAIDNGEPFSNLTPDALFELQHTAEVRLRALNWVCGFGEHPDTAPLDLDD
jgi:hypothetical protein